ncbi:uncharacterized protein LOC121736244 [Aricia agestis]|uniref:uncharacterized protein LOC121736244 n=1 Tax=Aricia agestis TaxID=91739 RepID=UPI001C2064D6|nr:uncharacterized protein LOC121736244 [Aricia agestis]
MQYIGGFINNEDSFYGRPAPRPSLAAQALSSVTEALTSIAKYDDYQCVPRLLCEASGGMSGLPSVPGLESLLTLLSAYTGLTTNPLFVFGRAVYLGVSSRGNPASCRYAYPQCPTDAEKLVHYLNNHNGGFFRFFNSPQQQQNLEQFYQNYQPPQPDQNPYPQNAGQYGFYKPNLYESQQQYGSAYNYNRHKTSKIQKRIQNKPNSNSVDEDDAKWTFPDGNADLDNGFYAEEDVNNFKFPESNKYDRKTRGFTFPTNFVENPTYKEPTNDKFIFSNQNQAYDDKRKYQYNKYTVYVVRGNGDPNRPEIIKLKPGQSISDF